MPLQLDYAGLRESRFPRNRPAAWLGVAFVTLAVWHWYSIDARDTELQEICVPLVAYIDGFSERMIPEPDLKNADPQFRDIGDFYRNQMWQEHRFLNSGDPLADQIKVQKSRLDAIERRCRSIR